MGERRMGAILICHVHWHHAGHPQESIELMSDGHGQSGMRGG